jgi:hypothetical protein
MKQLSTCVRPAGAVLVFQLFCFATAAQAAVINVAAGGNLQTALDSAQPGDTVVLPAGSRFVGQYRFPAKNGMVTLTSSGTLPSRRITPADAPLMATIVSTMGMMSIDMTDAKNWTLDGIRFEQNPGGSGEIIGIQRGENIVLRRLLLNLPSPQEQKRFILGNGRNITLTQSYCSGVWRSGQDSQCFVAWDGAGPYTITDNFLEAASENVMFGGADSISPDNIPSDILVENNLFSKRLEWKGQARGVKNIFELKSARRVTVRNNVFERNWIDAQSGSAIVFTPRNQNGTATWSVIEDVLFEYNVVRDTPSHFNILGYDDISKSGQTTRITIRHNLLLGTGSGKMVQIGNEVGELTIDHNTYVNPPDGSSSMATLYAEGTIGIVGGTRVPAFAVANLTFTNNMTSGNAYGLHSAVGFGTAALTAMTRGYRWTNNVIAGGWGTYPAVTTLLPVDQYPGQFDSSYYLTSVSPFKSMATDGADLGWNKPSATTPVPPPSSPTPTPVPVVVPVAITTTSLPAGRTTVPYAALVVASGGSGSFKWSLTSGALPPGLALDGNTGGITGAPTGTGTNTFTVKVDDAADATKTASLAYTVGVTAPVRVTTTSLPNGLKSRPYTATVTAAGAVGALTWTVTVGRVPPGLSLDPATGTISGRPTGFGAWTFTIKATDASSSASSSLTIQVDRK